MLGASAQAAQAMSTGPPKYEGSLRAGVKAFVREATENDGLRPEIAACCHRRDRHGDSRVENGALLHVR
jgi:hypothetical protein